MIEKKFYRMLYGIENAFVSVVPLCSIYLWCNQNVFKRILQWTNTIYSGRFDMSTTNCSLGILAKSLDGLPRAWVRIPPTPPLWQSALGEIRELFCLLEQEIVENKNVKTVDNFQKTLYNKIGRK